jgi:YHS domain-containing protein
MVRFRIATRSLRTRSSWAAGIVLAAAGSAVAAPSPGETLNSAVTRELDALKAEMVRPAVVEDAEAPRRLSDADDSAIRPASDQQTEGTAVTIEKPKKPQPSKSQLEVMRQLEELYKKDGREMPSMHMRDAPNTYLPKDRMIVKKGTTAAAQTAPSRSPSTASQNAPPANYSALFSEHSGTSPRKLSFFDKLRGKGRSTASTNDRDKGGLFAKLLSPFRKEPKTHAVPHPAPAPAPLPDYSDPSHIAAQPPVAPNTFDELTPRPLDPQIVAETQAVSSNAPSNEANPFAEVTPDEDAGGMTMVINPAHMHPLEDAFVEVRGESAPDIAMIAAVDPEFEDDNAFDATSPRTLEPGSVANADAFAPVSPEAVPPRATPEEATAARYAELQRKLAERSGLGGFQGYCPVALRDRRELVDARPEFLSIYQGRTYELASAEAKARFEADPTKYAPVGQGNDVVLVSRGETEVEGNLSYAVWFKDRLYLFRSTSTLREFNAEPTKFALAD